MCLNNFFRFSICFDLIDFKFSAKPELSWDLGPIGYSWAYWLKTSPVYLGKKDYLCVIVSWFLVQYAQIWSVSPRPPTDQNILKTCFIFKNTSWFRLSKEKIQKYPSGTKISANIDFGDVLKAKDYSPKK